MASSYPTLTDGALLPLVASAYKRTTVEDLIGSYAVGQIAMDVGIGLTGFLPIPGAGLAATAAAVAAQAPAIYQPMARKIAEVYSRSPDRVTGTEVVRGAIGGGLQDIAVYFGVEFFSEIASELIQELGAGALLAAVPVIGGFVGIALDVKIAWTMTWRVGMMIALYHENGGQWIKSRRHTYDLVRKCIKLREKGSAAPTIAEIVAAVPEVRERQVASVFVLAELLSCTGISVADIRKKLQERGFSSDLIEKAISRLSSS